MRGPCTAMKSGPCSPQLEKALAQKQRPNTAKNKKKFLKSVPITSHQQLMESGKREAPELALASLSEGRDRPGPSGCLSPSLGKEAYIRFLKDAFQKENGLNEDEKQWPRTAFKVSHTG